MRSKLNPLVTIIIPCYNGEDYLGEAIGSVLNQSVDNFEILVIDDGSKSRAQIKAICDSFDDVRIRYEFKENGGVSSALNRGLALAKAPVFCWLSHDDLFTTDRLERQLKIWNTTNGKRILFGNYSVFGPATRNPGLVDISKIIDPSSSSDLLANGLLNGCTVMASVSEILEIGAFDEGLKCTQDFDLWIRAKMEGFSFVYLHAELCKSRQHENQGSKTIPTIADENRKLWSNIGTMVFEDARGEGMSQKNIQRLFNLKNFISHSSYLAKFEMAPVVQKLEFLTKEALSQFKVRAICEVSSDIISSLNTLSSIFNQTVLVKEIVLVIPTQRNSSFEDQLEELLVRAKGFYRGEIVCVRRSESENFRNCGLSAPGKFDFVFFLRSGEVAALNKVEDQVIQLIKNKKHISISSVSKKSQEPPRLGVKNKQLNRTNIFKKTFLAGTRPNISAALITCDLLAIYPKNNKLQVQVFPSCGCSKCERFTLKNLIKISNSKVVLMNQPLTFCVRTTRHSRNPLYSVGISKKSIEEIGYSKTFSVPTFQITLDARNQAKLQNLKNRFVEILIRAPFSRSFYNYLHTYPLIRKILDWLIK